MTQLQAVTVNDELLTLTSGTSKARNPVRYIVQPCDYLEGTRPWLRKLRRKTRCNGWCVQPDIRMKTERFRGRKAFVVQVLLPSMTCLQVATSGTVGSAQPLPDTKDVLRQRGAFRTHVRVCPRGVIGSTMSEYPRGTGSNPVEGNGHFFLSCRQLYLSSFSDTLRPTQRRSFQMPDVTVPQIGVGVFRNA